MYLHVITFYKGKIALSNPKRNYLNVSYLKQIFTTSELILLLLG